MAKSCVAKMNRIQSERAAKAGLPKNGVSEAFSKMASSGEFPKGRVFVKSDTTDKDRLRTLVFFDRAKEMWVFQQDIKGQVQNRFESATEDGVYTKVQEYAAEMTETHSPENQIVNEWMATSKWGREFSTFDCANARHMMNEVLVLPLSMESLDKAFTTILDSEDHATNWFRFEQKRDRLTREAAEAEQAETPHENLPNPNESRKSEDNNNRAKDLKTLRREAIFGGKVATVPSTGTVRQPR
jgi:hypothetical protein